MQNRPPAAVSAVLVYISVLLCFSYQTAYTQTYNYYFGNTHSHSWYSDGNADKIPASYPLPVAKSIEYGRTQTNNFNWLAITDHNHNEGLRMTLPYWRSGVVEADTANKDGIFVGMYGMEWGTISGGGHVLVLGTDKLIGWNPGVYDVYVAKSDYTNLWRITDSLNAFCYLAHPNTSDFGNLAGNAYNAAYDKIIQGVAVKSGPAFSTNTTQTDPSTGNYESYYHSLLRKGYHVAPSSDQDNHNTNFGMSNQQRTVVLAPSLTRANILNGLRNRNAYASEDNNMRVKFEVGTHIMGNIFSSTSPFVINVKVSDATPGDVVSRIEIRYGVPGSGLNPTVLASATNVDSLIYNANQLVGSTYYYYVYVLQVDGHKVWTAPMWITAEEFLAVTFGPFTAEIILPNVGVALQWTTLTEINNYGFYVQRKKDTDPDFQTITTDIIPPADSTSGIRYYFFNDTTLTESGNYTYRILQIDTNGLEHYSSVVSVSYSVLGVDGEAVLPNNFKLYNAYPNPFNPSTTISFSLANAGYTTLKVYNLIGKEVATLFNGNAEAGRNYIVNFDASNLTSGMYFYKLQSGSNVEVRKLTLVK
jgi:hypothetical protein